MSTTELETIKSIAKESLMPDFFGARVDEEGLFGALQQLLSGIQLRDPTLDRMKTIANAATSATQFIDQLKAAKLWLPFKDLIAKIRVR